MRASGSINWKDWLLNSFILILDYLWIPLIYFFRSWYFMITLLRQLDKCDAPQWERREKKGREIPACGITWSSMKEEKLNRRVHLHKTQRLFAYVKIMSQIISCKMTSIASPCSQTQRPCFCQVSTDSLYQNKHRVVCPTHLRKKIHTWRSFGMSEQLDVDKAIGIKRAKRPHPSAPDRDIPRGSFPQPALLPCKRLDERKETRSAERPRSFTWESGCSRTLIKIMSRVISCKMISVMPLWFA